MKIILAGTYDQFRTYCSESGLSLKDARFVTDRFQLMGLKLRKVKKI